MSSKITTNLQPDDPVQLNGNYRFDNTDRRFIDDQVRGVQQHLADSLLNGTVATFVTTQDTVAAGDWLCLSGGLFRKATSANLVNAGTAFGICLVAAAALSEVRVAIGGAIAPIITGLVAGTPGLAKVNGATARTAVGTLSSGDFPVGAVDSQGMLTISAAIKFSSTAALATDLNLTGQSHGAISYFNGTNWVVLNPGTSGNILKTNGAGADPSWAAAAAADGSVLHTLSAGGGVSAGNVIGTASLSGGTAKKATSTVAPTGIATAAAIASATVTAQTTGIVPASLTGLAAGAEAHAIVDPTTGNLVRKTLIDGSERLMGLADTQGNVTLGFGKRVGTTPFHVINVKAAPYNAVGDGVTDDSAAINAAIQAAGAVSTSGGHVVFFPPGDYLVGSTPTDFISVDKQVVLWGCSAGFDPRDFTASSRIILKGGKGSADWAMVLHNDVTSSNASTSEGCVLQNITFIQKFAELSTTTGVLVPRPSWQANHTYLVGDEIIPASTTQGAKPVTGHRFGYYFKAKTVSGNSAGSEPAWPNGICVEAVGDIIGGSVGNTNAILADWLRSTVVDGGVTWEVHLEGTAIRPFVRFFANECSFEGFDGAAMTFACAETIPQAVVDGATITNCFIQGSAFSTTQSLTGLRFAGNNSQQNSVRGGQTVGCAIGLYDTSQTSNRYYDTFMQACPTRSVYVVGPGSFYGAYFEGDCGPLELKGNATIFGGFIDTVGLTSNSVFVKVYNTNCTPITVYANRYATLPTTGPYTVSIGEQGGSSVFSWVDSHPGTDAPYNAQPFRFGYSTASNYEYDLNWANSYPYVSFAITSPGSREGIGRIKFPRGCNIGPDTGTAGLLQEGGTRLYSDSSSLTSATNVSALNTSQTWKAGDFIFNNNNHANGILGWSVTGGATAGQDDIKGGYGPAWPGTNQFVFAGQVISGGGKMWRARVGGWTNVTAEPTWTGSTVTDSGSTPITWELLGNTANAMNFVPIPVFGGISTVNLASNTGATLDQSNNQSGRLIITESSPGTVTSTQTITLPLWTNAWRVVQNKLSTSALTFKSASGTGVTVLAGQIDHIWCDGTNWYGISGTPTVARLAQASTSWESGTSTDSTALHSIKGARDAVTTTNTATQTTVTTIDLSAYSGHEIEIEYTLRARQTAGTGNPDSARWHRRGQYRNVAGTINTVTAGADLETARTNVTGTTWTETEAVSGTNLLIKGTGDAAKTIEWHVDYTVTVY